MTTFTIEPLYGAPWVAVAAAILTVATIALVAPPTEQPGRRKWLIALRSVAAMVLLLAAFRPALVRSDNRPAPATVVVAADTSRSMTLPDGDGSDRWSTQTLATERLLQGIAGLGDRLDVRLLTYDVAAEVVAEAGEREGIAALAGQLQQLAPDGESTDLGGALKTAIDSSAGKPIAGVIVFGDGTQTASVRATGDDVSEQTVAARRGAEVLDALGVPLWTVPIGPPSSDASARDLAVSNLSDSYTLFAGNQFDVSFSIEASGMASVSVPVTVSWIATDGTRTEAASRQIDPRSARESVPVAIPLTAPDPGVYRLEARVAAQPGEWVTNNNSQTAFVEVREGGGRILILGGPGRPEVTFLRRSLRRFPDLELQYAAIRGEQTWPVSLDSVLRPGRMDVFVLGDLDARALGDEQLQQLGERVAEGAGLITLGGLQTYGIGGYADSPLADVLPIKMDASRRRQPTRGVLSPAERTAREPFQINEPFAIELTRNHPIVDLGGPEPQSVWRELPEQTGAYRFVGPRIAAGTQVLLQTPDEQPLLVIGSYGQGRVASLAIDQTYRWWRFGKADAHKRFWRQLMLWLMSREDTSGDSVVAELDRRRFESDANPAFRARVQRVGELPESLTLAAKVVGGEDQEIPLEVTATGGDDAGISGQLPDLEPGFYRLVVTADDESIQADEVAFQVTESSRELARPMADPVYLQQLADLTSSHGGGAYDPGQIDQLIETIRSKRRTAQTPVVEKQRLGDGPISGWAVFLIFAAAMSGEWFLRRRWGMA